MKINYSPNYFFKTNIQTNTNRPITNTNNIITNDIFTKSSTNISFKGDIEEIEKQMRNCQFCYKYYYDETSELVENTIQEIDEAMQFPNIDTSYIDEAIKALKTNIPKEEKLEIAFKTTEKIELQNKKYLEQEQISTVNKKGLAILKKALELIANNIKTIDDLENKAFDDIVENWRKELAQEHINYKKIEKLVRLKFEIAQEHSKLKNIAQMGEKLGNYVCDKYREYIEKRSEKIDSINNQLKQIYTLINK